MTAVSFSGIASKIEQIAEKRIKEISTGLEEASFTASANISNPTFNMRLDFSGIEGFEANLNALVSQVLREIAADLKGKLDASIVAFGLVKTGKLKNSLVIDVTSQGITIDYKAPYAALINYGGYVIPYGNPKAKPVYIAPKPWFDAVLQIYDFETIILSKLSSLGL